MVRNVKVFWWTYSSQPGKSFSSLDESFWDFYPRYFEGMRKLGDPSYLVPTSLCIREQHWSR